MTNPVSGGVPEQGLPELEALLREWLRVQPYQSSPGHEEWRADFRARVEAALERPRPALPLKLPPVPVDFEYDTFQRGPALPAPDTILARRGREAWLILRRILGAKAEHVEQRISEAHDWVARQPVLSADILRAESEGATLPAEHAPSDAELIAALARLEAAGWKVGNASEFLGLPAEHAPPRDIRNEFTLCEETGALAIHGACPTHHGDACLRAYQPVTFVQAAWRGSRPALAGSPEKADEYLRTLQWPGDDLAQGVKDAVETHVRYFVRWLNLEAGRVSGDQETKP